MTEQKKGPSTMSNLDELTDALRFYLRGALIAYDEAAQRRILDGFEEHLSPVLAAARRAEALEKLAADLIEYANALLGADLSYTELDPDTDQRAALARWPLTDSRVNVESVIESETWRAELDEARSILDDLATAAVDEEAGK